MLKEIFKNTIENLRKNWLYSLILSIMAVMMMVLTFSIDFVGYGFGTYLAFPFLLMPVLFAIQVTHFGLRQNVAPNGRLFFRFFKLYFNRFYRGVFRFIVSALFTLLVIYGATFLFGAIAIPIVESIDPSFSTTIDELIKLISEGSINEAQNLLLTNEEFRLVAYIAYLPSYGLGTLVFFLSSSFNSISTYFKIKNPNINPAFINQVYVVGRNSIRRNLIKQYWGTNWPIFVLFIIGYAGGAWLSYSINFTYTVANIVSMIIGFGAMVLYFPFFINNLEGIYIYNENSFANAPEAFQKRMEQILNSQMSNLEQQMDALRKQKEMEEQNRQNQQSQPTDAPKKENNDENKIIDAKVKPSNDDKNHQNDDK